MTPAGGAAAAHRPRESAVGARLDRQKAQAWRANSFGHFNIEPRIPQRVRDPRKNVHAGTVLNRNRKALLRLTRRERTSSMEVSEVDPHGKPRSRNRRRAWSARTRHSPAKNRI